MLTTILHKGVAWLTLFRSKTFPALQSWLATDQTRRYRAWLFQGYILASLVAFGVLTVFASTANYFSFDLKITRELQSELPTWVGTILVWVSWPGFVTGSMVTIIGTVLLLMLLRLRWESLVATLTAASSLLINNLIKFWIRRPRPDGSLVNVFSKLGSYSFPSGHVMFYTAFFGFLAFLSFTLVKRLWLRALLVILFIAMVVLVGPSRIYLGQHWASDVLGAYLLGFLILIAAISLYRWGLHRQITNSTNNEHDPS